MSPTNDPVDVHLASLAGSTLAAAPRPAPLAVVWILAERRRAELHSRRLLSLVAFASAAPMLIVVAALALRPAGAGASLLAVTVLALALAPAIDGIARLAGMKEPGSEFPSR